MTLVEFSVALVAGLYGIMATSWVTQKFDLCRLNFRGRRIPAVSGLSILLFGTFFYGYEWMTQGIGVGSAAAYFLAVVGFGVLGLNDDLAGDRSVGGFRGHFGALLRGRLTTGAAKAIGGGVVSLVAAFLIGYPIWPRMALAALLIALSANALNLVDLRPGRCLFAFLTSGALIAISLAANHHAPVGFLLYALMGLALVLYPLDASGQIMIGDTGSNSLGAVLGVAAALCLPLIAQVVVVAALIAFHIWCEGHSLTGFIESHPVLRRIDRKIGIR